MSSARDYPTQYGESFAGDVDVTEGFVESNLPVLSDAAFAKKLEFNTAARLSQYENQGKGPDFTSADTQHLHLESQLDLGSGRLAALPRQSVARQPCAELPRAVLPAGARCRRSVQLLRSRQARTRIRVTRLCAAT